jgi:arginine deiminase
MSQFGVHSEVGKLHTVMVCRPGLAHQRLTPANCRDLLFDDVLWVQEAQKDHYDFVLKMQQRGVEVLELHTMLAETLEITALRVVETGGNEYQAQRDQWDDGNNVVALEPGVVVAYERNSYTNPAAQMITGAEVGRGRGHCMTCPISRDPAY